MYKDQELRSANAVGQNSRARAPVAGARSGAAWVLCAIFFALAIVLGGLQLFLGSSYVVVLLAVATVLVTLPPIMAYGASHAVGVFFIFVCCYWSLNSLVVKTLLFQALDSFLYTPIVSHLVVFMAIFGAALGALLARPLIAALPKLKIPSLSAESLRSISNVSLVVGLVGMVLARAGGGVQALSVFVSSYIFMAFIAECGHVMLSSNGRKTLSLRLFVIAGVAVVASIANNSKFGIMTIPLAYFVTVLAFGGRFKVSQVIMGVMAAIVLSSVVFPAISFIARNDRDRVSSAQLVSNTFEYMGKLAVGDEATRARLETREAGNAKGAAGWRYDVPYQRHMPLVFERFLLVPYVDAIARRIDIQGPFVGTSFVLNRMKNVLPTFVYGDKVANYTGNEIVVALRLSDPGFAGFPTMGWPAETFYAGGVPFVFISSVVTFFLFSVLLIVALGSISRNIFSAFIVVRYFHLLTCGVLQGYAYFAVRQLPVDIILFFIIVWASKNFARGGVSQGGFRRRSIA